MKRPDHGPGPFAAGGDGSASGREMKRLPSRRIDGRAFIPPAPARGDRR